MFPTLTGRGPVALLRFPVTIGLALLLAACASLPESSDQPVQSPSDDYAYRYLTLDNGLRVLLVSDPDTPKAAAALDVLVGSGDNPPGREGLAHFLEHMLFLGTEKYPDPKEYEEFITEHGGNRNAYTSLENTNYFFDVNPEHLEGALDRFAQFFIGPKFDAEYVDREMNAVEAEYQMGLKSDPRRGFDVLQENMNPAHPFSQFTVGSLDTLADRPDDPIREDLLRFYDRHYSANVMRLAVLGAEPLDELEAMVVPMFSPVANSDFEPPQVDEPIFDPDSLPKLIQVQPLATQRTLDMSFPVPEYRKDYRLKPMGYLGHLVGHEGEGSLLSQLKAEGLAEGLSAGTGVSWRGGSLFSVGVTLTEQGAENPERVMQLFFSYMDMLREAGPQEWLFEEESKLSEIDFQFKEQGSPMRYVSALASDMHRYAPRDSLRGPYMMEDYDAPVLADLMARITPDNMVATLSDMNVEGDQVSKRYEVSYSVAPLDPTTLVAGADDPAAVALRLPEPNAFIAEDLSLQPLPASAPDIPVLVHDSERQRIWYKQDEEFRLPRGVIQIEFRAPGVWQSPVNSARAMLYAAMLNDQFNEITYPARLAGMGFSLYKHDRGLALQVSGYSDKQLVLMEQLLADMTAPAFEADRFANVRQNMIRGLQNAVAKRPSTQVLNDLRESLIYGYWGEQALIDALEQTSQADLQQWGQDYWQTAGAVMMLYGNYDEARVEAVSALVEGILPEKAVPGTAPRALLRLAPGERLQYRVDVPHDDSVLAWYLQGAGTGWVHKAATALTGQITKSGFFQQLRTEQQLGYIVSSFYWPQMDVPALVLLIQSPVASAAGLESAMQTFMEGVVADLDEEQFERHKAALISDIMRPDKNISERAGYYWRAIGREQEDFAAREHLSEAVQALTLADWTAYFQQTFMDQRHSLQVVTPGRWDEWPQLQDTVFEDAQSLRDDHARYDRP